MSVLHSGVSSMTVFIDSLDGVSNIMIALYNGICGKSGLYYLTKR